VSEFHPFNDCNNDGDEDDEEEGFFLNIIEIRSSPVLPSHLVFTRRSCKSQQ